MLEEPFVGLDLSHNLEGKHLEQNPRISSFSLDGSHLSSHRLLEVLLSLYMLTSWAFSCFCCSPELVRLWEGQYL